MIGEKLYERILRRLSVDEDDFDERAFLDALNEFFEELLTVVKVIDVLPITIDRTDIFYNIPLKIFRIYRNDQLYYDWEQIGENVSFKDPGNYEICYMVTRIIMNNLTEEIPISGVYLPAAAAYVKHCFWELEDEMDRSDYFEQQFRDKAVAAYNKYRQDYAISSIRTKRR